MIAGTVTRSRLAATIPEALAHDTTVLLVPLDGTPWEAAAAWAIARACATAGRRVLLVDGTVGRFDLADGARAQVTGGITDAFFRNAPLEDVARLQEPGLFFVGPGSAPAAGDLWSHTRWTRLAKGFAHEKALLLVYAPLKAVDRLPLHPDRMVLLGGERDVPPVLSARAAEWETLRVVADPAPRRSSGLGARGQEARRTAAPRARRALPWPGIAVAGIAVAALFAIRYLPYAGGDGEDAGSDSLPGGPPVVSGGTLAESSGVAAVAAPSAADSLYYTVQVAAFQSESQAVEHAGEYDRDDVVVTVAPVRLGLQGTWYRVLVGAYASAAGAQAALQDLYDAGRLERAQGTILRTPHALSLGGHPEEAGAREALAALREAEVPAYIVEARGGAVRILVGAFERPDQAALLDSLLTGRGLTATLVQRTGIVR